MSSSSSALAPRFLPLLLVLFVGSGCAALIYEIVWLQMLQLVIGSSAVSLAVLLGTFMGGMCLGSLLLPRWISAKHHPLRVYAVLELGIALAALVVFFAMPAVSKVYTTLVGHGMPGIFLRALVCVICLLPPTIMMGATLPAVARWIEATPRGVSWLGFFYGGNTAGAVAGCVLAGFYLLRVHDMATASGCAIALNVLVAAIAFVLSRKATPASALTPSTASIDVSEESAQLSSAAAATPSETPNARAVYLTIGLSGLCALAAEVVWARTLSLLLGATVYTFSIILAVFLIGLGIGSSVGAALARNIARPRAALGLCQLLQAVTLTWAGYNIAVSLPFQAVDPALHATPWARFQGDIFRCVWTILPAALLWGASFPLALAALARPGQDSGRLVGRAYAANTLGAILGALSASLLLIPQLGTHYTQQLLIALTLVSAALALFTRPLVALTSGLAAALLVLLVAPVVPKIPWQLVAYGRQIAISDYGASPLYLGEGMNSTVAVTETPGGARFFHVSGKTEASSLAKDMRLQRMLGHIPALLHPNPKSVLIVGCGAGVTAGSFVVHPSIERIVICDIERLIPQVIAPHFQAENHDVVRDPRVQVVYDDARHFIATTKEKFDLITSDPIHPWVKGSAVLYSQEYFQLCRDRLNPGGLVTQWVPLYESDRAVVQSEIATFFSVFPHGSVWANDDEGQGYDTVLLGQAEPLKVDVDALQRRLDREDHLRIRDALRGLGMQSAAGLLSTYAGRHVDLREWLTGAEINRDRNLRLQYLAGLQLESSSGMRTYNEMLAHRRFPTDMLSGNEDSLEKVRTRMELSTAP